MNSVPLSSIIRAMEELTYHIDLDGGVHVQVNDEWVEVNKEAATAIEAICNLAEQINCYGVEIDLDIDEEDHATLWSDSIEY